MPRQIFPQQLVVVVTFCVGMMAGVVLFLVLNKITYKPVEVYYCTHTVAPASLSCTRLKK